jgi:S1-C subfamily serine protease
VTGLDWIIVAFAVLLALSGYYRGFIVGALSLAGFVVGAIIGTRIATALLSSGSSSPYAPAFGLFGALLAGGILATGLEGLGLRLRGALRIPGLGVVDGLLGSGLSACLALGIAWVLGAVALQAPGAGNLRRDIQRSLILQRLNQLLPPSGVILNALARIDPLPAITGPSAGVPPPTPAIAHNPAVRATFPSVVRVLGTACGLGIEGSGWVAGPDEVVTNAHVVAGETDTVVEASGHPPNLSARAIVFDPRNDIAVLRVPGLGLPALRLGGNPPVGEAAAILGYPENGPFRVRAGRVGPTQDVLTQDAYGRGPVSRLVTPLRGVVLPGNSGGPMVDGAGRVATTVFASTTGGGPRGGFGVANSVVSNELAHASARVTTSTGPCTG